MADIAWIEVTRYNRPDDTQKKTTIQEQSLAHIEPYLPEDPDNDFYYQKGVRTYVETMRGSQLWLLDEYIDILAALKAKVVI